MPVGHQQKKERTIFDINVTFLTSQQSGASVLSAEVESGTKGAMQSLRILMEEKNIQTGVRCSLKNFGTMPNIRIYPLYAAGKISYLK